MTTLRCRLFGHDWGALIDGRWHRPTWWTGGAETFFVCKRCPTRYIDTDLEAAARAKAALDRIFHEAKAADD